MKNQTKMFRLYYEAKVLREIEAEACELLDKQSEYMEKRDPLDLIEYNAERIAFELDVLFGKIDRRYDVRAVGSDEIVVYLPPSCCLLRGSSKYIISFFDDCYLEVSPSSQIHIFGENGKELFENLEVVLGCYRAEDCMMLDQNDAVS